MNVFRVIRNRILKRMCNMIVLYKYRKTWNKMLGVQYIDGGRYGGNQSRG